jgi:hypothetical protein
MAVTWKKLAYSDDPPAAHNLLDSTVHGDVLTDTVTDGDVIIGNATPKWSSLAISVPAATFINMLGVGNGETRPSWKALFDATAPSTQAAGDAAAAGTATVAARRDHKHALPSTYPATAHALLDGSVHNDTLADAVTDGDIIIGNVTPKWSSLAISVPAAGLYNYLGVTNGETRPSWKAMFDATVPTTIAESAAAAAGSAAVAARRDHTHGAPATWAPTAHALSAHNNAAAAVPFNGYQATNLIVHQVADAAALAALTPVVGKIAMQVDTLHAYICTVAA